MAIKKTRQRQRGGPYSKFDKTKTLPREFQIVESGDPNSKDGRAVYIAFEAGEPKRLSTYEDMQEDIDNATEEIQGTLTAGVDEKIKEADAAITSAKSAATKANTATTNANKATDSANKAADNANKAVENIQSKVAINDKQPSDTTAYSGNKIETEFLKKNGDSSKTAVTFEVATQRANIQPQDTLEVAFGKLAKFCGDLKSHAFTAPVNNLAGTNPDLALAAPQGSELKKQVDALNSTLKPVEIFVGARAINVSEPWHNTLQFFNFSKIDMMITFQDGHFILPFYTYKNDNMKQSFSFSYFNQTDNKGRIIAGNMVFAGRYTDRVTVVMSYGLQGFQQIDASGITVNRIIGYY